MRKAVIFDMYETLITQFDGPLYFGSQMAVDAGIPEDSFLPPWRRSDLDRTLGTRTLEEVVEEILRENHVYTEEKCRLITEKRICCKKDAFTHLHPGIVPLLQALKKRNIKIGLISNCYSEEAAVIRNSVLFPLFDVVCLSCEEGLRKPDQRLFSRCLERLNMRGNDCLYVGDGGSHELEAAYEAGMKPLQAVWYLKENSRQPVGRLPMFDHAETPMEVLDWIETSGKDYGG